MNEYSVDRAIEGVMDAFRSAMHVARGEAKRLLVLTEYSQSVARYGDLGLAARDEMTTIAYDTYNLPAKKVQKALEDGEDALLAKKMSKARKLNGATAAAAPPFVFEPAPNDPPDPAKLARREWLYRRHYLRGVVSATLGAPGRLKSTTSLTEVIGMTVGRDLLSGKQLACGPLRGGYLNGEENQEELDRRTAAICQRYGIAKKDYEGRLWIKSTRDTPLRFALLGPKGAAMVNDAVAKAVLAWCEARGIDVLVCDPLISFHSVRENDSGDMDLLFKEAFGTIAGKNRSVDLVVHPRKPAPGEVNTTVDDLRGSSAQLGALRIGRTFNFMTTAEATQLGIEEAHRRLHVRIETGKGGPGPLDKAEWVKIEVETLPNGDPEKGLPGDDVAVAVAWKPPNYFADVTIGHMETVRNWGRTGEYRVDRRSPKWLGWKVADMLGLKARYGIENTAADIAKIRKLLNTWHQNKVLGIAKRPDEKSNEREFYVAGEALVEASGNVSPVDFMTEED